MGEGPTLSLLELEKMRKSLKRKDLSTSCVAIERINLKNKKGIGRRLRELLEEKEKYIVSLGGRVNINSVNLKVQSGRKTLHHLTSPIIKVCKLVENEQLRSFYGLEE